MNDKTNRLKRRSSQPKRQTDKKITNVNPHNNWIAIKKP